MITESTSVSAISDTTIEQYDHKYNVFKSHTENYIKYMNGILNRALPLRNEMEENKKNMERHENKVNWCLCPILFFGFTLCCPCMSYLICCHREDGSLGDRCVKKVAGLFKALCCPERDIRHERAVSLQNEYFNTQQYIRFAKVTESNVSKKKNQIEKFKDPKYLDVTFEVFMNSSGIVKRDFFQEARSILIADPNEGNEFKYDSGEFIIIHSMFKKIEDCVELTQAHRQQVSNIFKEINFPTVIVNQIILGYIIETVDEENVKPQNHDAAEESNAQSVEFHVAT